MNYEDTYDVAERIEQEDNASTLLYLQRQLNKERQRNRWLEYQLYLHQTHRL